jgi:hypothetical protein
VILVTQVHLGHRVLLDFPGTKALSDFKAIKAHRVQPERMGSQVRREKLAP